jgi:hypothetical protein
VTIVIRVTLKWTVFWKMTHCAAARFSRGFEKRLRCGCQVKAHEFQIMA